MKASSIVAVLFLVTIAIGSAQAQDKCADSIDIALVLDGSTSVSPNSFIKIKAFALNFTEQFQRRFANIRIGLVQFSTDTRIEFNLTSQVPAALALIRELLQLGGTTFMTKALQQGQLLLESGGRIGVPKLLVLLSDGLPFEPDTTDAAGAQALAVRDAGTRVLTIGVGLLPEGKTFLDSIASTAAFAFEVDDANGLPAILDQLVGRTCVGVNSLSNYCGLKAGGSNITVRGSNLFASQGARNRLVCRFIFSNGATAVVNAYHINDQTITCTTPPAPAIGDTTLEVSIDGQSFVEADNKYTYVIGIDDCSAVGSSGFFILLIGVPLILAVPLLTALGNSAGVAMGIIAPVAVKRQTVVKKAAAPYVPPVVVAPVAAAVVAAPVAAAAAATSPEAAPEPIPEGALLPETDPRYKWQVAGNAYLWNLGGAGAAPLRVNFAGKAPPSADSLLKMKKGHDEKFESGPEDGVLQEGPPPGVGAAAAAAAPVAVHVPTYEPMMTEEEVEPTETAEPDIDGWREGDRRATLSGRKQNCCEEYCCIVM